MLDLLRTQWGVEKPGQALADSSTLGSDEFVREVENRRGSGRARLSKAARSQLRRLYVEGTPPLADARVQLVALERRIAEAVHAAFGLDAADLALLRATAAPRMPAGW
jgi:hypothetical protein